MLTRLAPTISPTPVIVMLAALTPFAACGQEDGPSTAWLEFYSGEAARYQFETATEPPAELDLHPTPILTYSNPVRLREQHGAVFVWTHQGRPEVIGTVWSKLTADMRQRRVAHEFDSLSLAGVRGERDGETFWECAAPGIDPRPVPDTPNVASTPRARQLQLRSLARAFSATAADAEGSGESALRLMPRPLFRFEAPDAGVVEGGLFAFVMATDPELFLLFEARETDAGPVWHYAAVRFTTVPLRLSYNEDEIWQCPAHINADVDDGYHYNPQVYLRDPVP